MIVSGSVLHHRGHSKTKPVFLNYFFSAKNHSEIDKPLGCVGSYKVINTEGNVADKANQMGELANEKNIASTQSSFFTIGISSKGTNNEPEYAVSNKIKFINSIVKDEPTYSVSYDRVVMQEVANNNVYSVIGENYIDNEVYYDAVGKEDHIYDEINYGAIEEKAEPIYEEIGNYASDKTKNHPDSNEEIDLTKPNNLSTFEKTVLTRMGLDKEYVLKAAVAVNLNEERAEITKLAAQTFAPPKSFISRLASSIWNALFGSKNESEIVQPADLVARAMGTNINGICNALNKQIATGNVDGIFRKSPNNTTYNKGDVAQLVKVFNSEECYSNPIGLAWMIKHYIAENLPKITIDEFNDNKNQTKFNKLLNNKIDKIESDIKRANIKSCFVTIKNTLKVAKKLLLAKELLTNELNSAKESNQSKESLINQFNLAKESLAKELMLEKKLLDNGLKLYK